MASEPLVGGLFPAFTEAPSVGSRAQGNGCVGGFLDFEAGFAVVACFRFLEVPKRFSHIPFMVSVMSLIIPPGRRPDGLADSSSESSSRWGAFPSSSLGSSLRSVSSSSSSLAAEGNPSSSGEDSFPVVLEMGLSSSTSGSDPSSRGSAGFGRSSRYFNPILGTVFASVTSVSRTSSIFGMWLNLLSLYHSIYSSAARRPALLRSLQVCSPSFVAASFITQ